jgi:hypothetical protein
VLLGGNCFLENGKSKMEIGKRSQAPLGGAWDFCFCGRREEFTRRTPREEHGEHRERNEGRKNKANAETRRTLRIAEKRWERKVFGSRS